MTPTPVERAPWVRRLGSGLAWALLAGLLVVVWPSSLGGCTGLIVVSGHSMEPTLMPSDLVLTRCGEAQVGDVVAYHPLPGQRALIIHRITGGDAEGGWVLQGDNNDFEDPFRPTQAQVQGVMVFHVPGVGSALSVLSSPLVWGSAFLLAAAVLLWPRRDTAVEPGEDGTEDGDETEAVPLDELVEVSG